MKLSYDNFILALYIMTKLKKISHLIINRKLRICFGHNYDQLIIISDFK